jgi:serine/threonine protein kinase
MAPQELIYQSAENQFQDELQPGTDLLHGQYSIVGYLNSGGFGMTYLAKDSLDRDVVIKECFASEFCRRTNGRIGPRSAGNQGDLDKIIRSFLYEARSLSRLSHPNIVGVHQIFEDNSTAYMALDYVRGSDLLQIIEDGKRPLEPNHIVSMTRKLVSAVAYVHQNQLIHCDISPDNIMIDLQGEPILIDFGAARSSASDARPADLGASFVKDGYSPHELYCSKGSYGPWSDLYGLAASLHHVIRGTAPPNSQMRLSATAQHQPDSYQPLAGSFPNYPPRFLESIDKAMNVMPSSRFQSAEDWLEVLNHPHGYEGTNVKFLKKAAVLNEPDRPEKKSSSANPADGNSEPKTTPSWKGKEMAIDISALKEITGFIGACVVDSESGMMIAAESVGKFDLETASAANTEVVKAKLRAMEILGLNDHIEDILISLGKQLHLIRPLEKTPSIFIYVALDRKLANLGLARAQVKKVEQSVSI